MRNSTWAPFLSLLHREIRRYLKVLFQTVLTPVVNACLYLLIFGVSLGDNIQLHSNITYLAFIIPGLVMMSCLNNAFQNSSSSIVSGKFSGDVEDWKVSPLTSSQIVWALCIGALTRGIFIAILTYFVGQVFYILTYNELLSIAHPMALLFFLVVGGLVFSMLGIIVAFKAKSFDGMSAVSALILTPLMFLGGVFFSLDNLSPFWKHVSIYNPLLYFINGVRYGILGQSDVSVTFASLISAVSLVLFFFISLYTVKTGRFQRW